jgi:hypothetical protein
MHWIAMAVLILVSAPEGARAAELKPQTVAAFDSYIRQAEQRLDARKVFLWAGESAVRARRVRQGEIAVEPFSGKAEMPVTGGLVHDWVGAVFIPGAALEKTALSENVKRPHPYAALRRTRNSVLSAASRCAFSSK